MKTEDTEPITLLILTKNKNIMQEKHKMQTTRNLSLTKPSLTVFTIQQHQQQQYHHPYFKTTLVRWGGAVA